MISSWDKVKLEVMALKQQLDIVLHKKISEDHGIHLD
jgi:hypothetical protein